MKTKKLQKNMKKVWEGVKKEIKRLMVSKKLNLDF